MIKFSQQKNGCTVVSSMSNRTLVLKDNTFLCLVRHSIVIAGST